MEDMADPLYQNAQLLLKDQHRNLRLNRDKASYAFARKNLSAPIAGIEFEPAAASMPIVFVKIGDQLGPVVMTAIDPNSSNTKIDDDGMWKGYVPAWFRRYPFAQTDEDMVCFDPQCDWLDQEAGERLFEEDGTESDTLKSIVALLISYKNDLETTQAFTQKLVDLDLLQDMNISWTQDGQQKQLQGMQMVNITKLKALPDDKVLELFKSDELAWIYFHLASLHHSRDLLEG